MGLGFEHPHEVDPDETLRRAQRLVHEDPSPNGYGLAGMILATAGLQRTAVKYLIHSVERDEGQPSTWFNLGQAYVLINEKEKGSDALIRALRLRRDFSKIPKDRVTELPARVREYLSGIEERYQELLQQRSGLMEKAVKDLHLQAKTDNNPLLTIGRYEVKRAANLTQFVIHLKPDGTTMTFCYPEELRDAEILMPFRIPKGIDFGEQKTRFMDHFGYKEFEMTEESDESPKNMAFFGGLLKYDKLTAEYLLRWLVRSIMFEEAAKPHLVLDCIGDPPDSECVRLLCQALSLKDLRRNVYRDCIFAALVHGGFQHSFIFRTQFRVLAVVDLRLTEYTLLPEPLNFSS